MKSIINKWNKYCEKCGTKNILIAEKDYDSETGNRNYAYQCPNPKCEESIYYSYPHSERGGNIFDE